MNFSRAYITSWFGPGAKNLERRKRDHLRQLEWCYKADLKPVVFAQEYSDADFQAGVEYIINEGPTLIADSAKTVLLKKFYETDEDYGLMLDDDSILYSGAPDGKYADGDSFITNFRSIPLERLQHVDLFFPISPRHEPFSKFTTENKATLEQNVWFEYSIRAKGSMIFLKNLKKHHNKEIYIDGERHRDANGVFVGGGDMYFAYECVFNVMGVYKCKNIILNDLGSNYSSWADGDKSRENYLDVLDGLLYTDFGVKRSKFKQTYFTHPSRLLIEKEDNSLEKFL